jgi:hypothetical protein
MRSMNLVIMVMMVKLKKMSITNSSKVFLRQICNHVCIWHFIYLQKTRNPSFVVVVIKCITFWMDFSKLGPWRPLKSRLFVCDSYLSKIRSHILGGAKVHGCCQQWQLYIEVHSTYLKGNLVAHFVTHRAFHHSFHFGYGARCMNAKMWE